MRDLAARVVIAFVCLCPSVYAENWTHWRGPTGNGTAGDAKPPIEWSDSKNVKWKVAIPGRGMSTPVIWEDRVYVTSGVPIDGKNLADLPLMEFRLICFDRATGKQLWEKVACTAKPHQQTHGTNSFSSASPCTDGKLIYAHFGSRGLYCYTLDGDLKWKRDDFPKMETLNRFGEGSSPTLVDGMILVPWDHQGPSALYALNKLTGKDIWKKDRNEETGWCTPLVVEHNGRKQVVMNGKNYARSYDLETGDELWRCSGQTVRPIASAFAADGLIFVGSGFQGAFMAAFRPDGHGDIKGTDKVVWTLTRDCSDMASPTLSQGRIYFHKGKEAMLSCVDAATGKPHYMAQRIGIAGQVYSSPVAANGYVYLTGRSGTTVVIKDADDLQIVKTNEIGETVSATLAPVDNEVFLRGENHLFCIAETK